MITAIPLHQEKDWQLQTTLHDHDEISLESLALKCLVGGCNTSVLWHFNNSRNNTDVNGIGSCDVPLISLSFWQTDFDKSSEYVEIYIESDKTTNANDESTVNRPIRLGKCNGVRQDYYDSIYLCFEDIELTDIIEGEFPEWVRVTMVLSSEVDRNWLDGGVSTFVFDANVSLWCSDYSQNDIIEHVNPTEFDTTQFTAWDVWIECSQVSCQGEFEWDVVGECKVPRLSFFYFANS